MTASITEVSNVEKTLSVQGAQIADSVKEVEVSVKERVHFFEQNGGKNINRFKDLSGSVNEGKVIKNGHYEGKDTMEKVFFSASRVFEQNDGRNLNIYDNNPLISTENEGRSNFSTEIADSVKEVEVSVKERVHFFEQNGGKNINRFKDLSGSVNEGKVIKNGYYEGKDTIENVFFSASRVFEQNGWRYLNIYDNNPLISTENEGRSNVENTEHTYYEIPDNFANGVVSQSKISQNQSHYERPNFSTDFRSSQEDIDPVYDEIPANLANGVVSQSKISQNQSHYERPNFSTDFRSSQEDIDPVYDEIPANLANGVVSQSKISQNQSHYERPNFSTDFRSSQEDIDPVYDEIPANLANGVVSQSKISQNQSHYERPNVENTEHTYGTISDSNREVSSKKKRRGLDLRNRIIEVVNFVKRRSILAKRA